MKKQMHHNSTEHNHKLTWIVHNWVRNKRREKKKQRCREAEIKNRVLSWPPSKTFRNASFDLPLSTLLLLKSHPRTLSHNCLINFFEFQLILLVSIQLLSVFQSARRRRRSSLRITWIRFFSLRSPPRSVALRSRRFHYFQRWRRNWSWSRILSGLLMNWMPSWLMPAGATKSSISTTII